MDKPHPRNHKLGTVLLEMLSVEAKARKRKDIVVLVDLRTVNRLRLAGLGRPGKERWVPL